MTIAERRMRNRGSSAWKRLIGPKKPAGLSAVADATSPRAPSSRAIAPPRELPATCGLVTPHRSNWVSRWSHALSIEYRMPPAKAGDSPNPERSGAMTS